MLEFLNRILARILLLAVLALSLLALVGYLIIGEREGQLFEQKKNDIRHIVESAHGIVSDYDEASSNVNSVASATEELTGSVNEIACQVDEIEQNSQPGRAAGVNDRLYIYE
jgi:hypothetical protein